jgi:UDP-2,3-diacylglucosamine hydrolase
MPPLTLDCMKAYFISDVHLGLASRETEKAKENRLLGFLHGAVPDTEFLVIAGDLFDFWFDYKTVIPRGFHRTLAALQEFTDAGRKVHYLVGNHDCWMGDFFETEIGAVLHREPFELTIQGKRVRVHHGTDSPTTTWVTGSSNPCCGTPSPSGCTAGSIPTSASGSRTGRRVSSRAYTTTKHYGEEQGMIRYAEKVIGEGVDVVVMGHHHKPAVHQIGRGVYVNLGDWISYNTYGEMSEGSIALKTWNGPQEESHAR